MFKKVLLVIATALLLAQIALAAGEWKQVGKKGAWAQTIAGTVLAGKVYTTEASGALFVIDPPVGRAKQIGKPDFKDTRHMFATQNKLFSILKDGALFDINPVTGAWKQIGRAGDWAKTIADTVMGNNIYTVEDNGTLYETNADTLKYRVIGSPNFKNAAFIFNNGKSLFTLETNGNLYAVNPDNGARRQLGANGRWAGTLAVAVSGARLYSAAANGGLYETNLETGELRQLGQPRYRNTAFMFSAGGYIYTIFKDGTLNQVNIK